MDSKVPHVQQVCPVGLQLRQCGHCGLSECSHISRAPTLPLAGPHNDVRTCGASTILSHKTVFSEQPTKTSFHDFVDASRFVRVNAPKVVGTTVAGGIGTIAVGWVKTVARVVLLLTDFFFLARRVEMVVHVMQMIDNRRWNETHATAEK